MKTQLTNEQNSNSLLVRGIAAIFWLGFFMAISFMEAPLKFTASGISLAQGLQIGRIVFGMLNHLELVFFATIVVTCFRIKPGRTEFVLIGSAGVILLLETFWLLPALDRDAATIINGGVVAGHSRHWYYIILEVIKVPVLLLLGIKSLQKRSVHHLNKLEDSPYKVIA